MTIKLIKLETIIDVYYFWTWLIVMLILWLVSWLQNYTFWH